MRFFRYFVMIILVIFAIIPFYVLFMTALSGSPSGGEGVLIREFHWSNFSKAWELSNMSQALFNSIAITFCAIFVSVLFSSSASFAIVRVPTTLHKIVFFAFIFSMLVPAIINIVPLYTLMRQIHGINTIWAMSLLLATTALPLSIFVYSNFIRGLSKEIEEAAIIDGCSLFTAFWRVTFPLLRPVTATVIILTAVPAWNNYTQSVFFLQDRSMQTIPLAISSFFTTYGADWSMMAAASVIGMLPTVLVFLFLQRSFIKGMTAGAVKG
ncbi:carbohydrate ABC transporter permease [Paenibacillus sp. B-A-8]|uniref:carbohydrate ABC transporter permease n=1 Tax=Paenibacillus sp. B-A-8 TaxID=3400419 RepID=UPI003B01390C